jgi:tRNA-dihydrouridine synthase
MKYPLVARIVEENGGQMLAVHARTKVQGYEGEADWDAIAEVVELLQIPVIGNGDVNTVQDIQKMKEHTGCAGVMIGRGARNNPWIFSRIDRGDVDPYQVKEIMHLHLKRNLEFYGHKRGLVLFRKHAAHYLAPYDLPVDFRKKLLTEEEPDDFTSLLNKINWDSIHFLN